METFPSIRVDSQFMLIGRATTDRAGSRPYRRNGIACLYWYHMAL